MPLLRSKIAKLTQDTRTNEEAAIELINKRIARTDNNRKDFMTRILEQRDTDQVSNLQLAAHASDFIVAGSDTTSVALSTMTYYLLKTPEAMKKLKQEVRAAFASCDEIDAQATSGLSYLRAVILEGLRTYPPLPLSLPRVVPEGGEVVDGHFLPSGVRPSHLCTSDRRGELTCL